jgi:hypothetical protein
MRHFTKRTILAVIAILGFYLLPGQPAIAQIKDPTGTFSPQAVQKGEAAMGQIKRKYKTEFLVEVFPEAPAEVRNAPAAQREVPVRQWAESRARELKVGQDKEVPREIYVLISRNPNIIEPWIGQNTLSSGLFTAANQRELGGLMLRHFREGKFDEGLQAATSFVDQTLSKNAAQSQQRGGAAGAPTGRPGGGGSGGGWLWIILIVGGLFLLFAFLRRRMAAAHGGYGPGGYSQPGYGQPGYGHAGYGQPQGGLGRGVMGGLLGGLGGYWLGSKIFGQGNQANAAPPDAGGGYNPVDAPPDEGIGSAGGGGSFDAPSSFDVESSGGDFGGGGDFDSGGGEF